MKPLPQAIEAMRAALKDEVPPSSVEEAAALYAQLCTDVERRLDRVASMLEKGSDYQALQVAEEDPPLLDLAASLSFGEEKNWQLYCESRGLRVAPRLNARTVEDLENLYARGISANHPLYKDFRAAVLSRDDEKALRIVKTILKLNSEDENARKELQRLENKALQEKIDLLREALKTDDEERIATLTESIKAAAPPDKLDRLDVFQQGDGIRRALRRRQAITHIPGMVATMQKMKAEGQWRQVGQMLEALNGLLKEHGLSPADKEQRAAIDELTSYHQKEKAADEKQRSFDRALKSFLVFVDDVETRLLTGSGVTFEEVAAKDESFVKRWKELEGYQLPVANDSLNRIRTAGQELRARLERMQRTKRVLNMALAAGALTVMCATSAVCLHAWKAWTLTQELASYHAKENTGAAEDLIKKLRSEEALLLRWPYLQAKIEEVNSWTARSRGVDKQADAALLALETTFKGDSTSLPPVKLVKQMEDAEALVKQLGGDLAGEQKNRLKALKTKTDLHLAMLLKKLSANTGATLEKMELQSKDELTHEKPASKVSASITAMDQKLKPLEALMKPEVPALALPADLEARIRALRKQLATYQEDVTAFAAIRTDTARAVTLEEYRKVLGRWQAVKFAEATPAVKALDMPMSEKVFQAALFTGGDQEMLQAILDDKSGRYMAPDTLLDSELKVILGLLHDENLNNIFESKLTHYSSSKASTTVYSRGKPEEKVIANSARWSSKFYEPDPSQLTVLFIQKSYARAGALGEYQGDAIISSRLTPTSEFMNFLEIGRVTDEKGERVLKSLLEVFERVVRDKIGSPIAKAYVMLKLEDMMRLRPREWGLHYCPTLQQDLRALHQTLGMNGLRSEDWLVSAMREKWLSPLTSFFATLQSRKYLTEAVAHRNYLRTATTAGLKFGGYVETDQTLALNKTGKNAGELWVLSKEKGKPLLVPNVTTGNTPGDKTKAIPVPGAEPLSPVFFVPMDRQALIHQYKNALSENGLDLNPPPGEPLFLTHP